MSDLETATPVPSDPDDVATAEISTPKHRSRGLEHGCRCGERWGGVNTSHCSACHLTFSTVANFDRHQRGGECSPPESVGLVRLGRAYPCWGQPGGYFDDLDGAS